MNANKRRVELIEYLSKFDKVIVSGPQRTGTTLFAYILADYLEYDLIQEEDFGVHDAEQFLKFVKMPGKMVIQCPAVSASIDLANDLQVVYIFMMRNLEDILASQIRVNWNRELNIDGTFILREEHEKTKYLQRLSSLNQSGELSSLLDFSKPIAQIKYAFWNLYQKKKVDNYIEFKFEEVKYYFPEYWLSKFERRQFKARQVIPEQYSIHKPMESLDRLDPNNRKLLALNNHLRKSLVELSSKFEARVSELDQAFELSSSKNKELLATIENLKRTLFERENDNASIKIELDDIIASKRDLENVHDQKLLYSQKQIEEQRRQIAILEKNFKTIESKYQSLQKGYPGLHKEIQDLRSSTSYKVGRFLTLPLRAVYNVFVPGKREVKQSSNLGMVWMVLVKILHQPSLLTHVNKQNLRIFFQALKSEPRSILSGNINRYFHNIHLASEQKKRAISQGFLSTQVFNWAYYRSRYPDLTTLEKNELETHWITHGIGEGRSASPFFSLPFYVRTNKDVRTTYKRNFNGVLKHWLKYGIKERRFGSEIMKKDNAFLLVWENVSAKELEHLCKKAIENGYQRIGQKFYQPNLNTDQTENSKFKVLFVGHSSNNHPYGAEKSLLELLQAAQFLNYQSFLILPEGESDYLLECQKYVEAVFQLPMTWKGNPLSTEVAGRIEEILKTYEIDLVHVNTCVLQEPFEAAKKARVPSIVHVRELLREDPDLRHILGLQEGEERTYIESLGDHLICNSFSTWNAFSNFPGKHLLFNTIDKNLFNLPERSGASDRIEIGIVGTLSVKKGVHDIDRIVAGLKSEGVPFHFHIFGEFESKELEDNYQHWNNVEDITLHGYVKDVLEIYPKFDVLINLSYFSESFGRTIAEGMATGKCVVTYGGGAVWELIQHGRNGFIVPEGDIESVIRTIRDIISNPQIRNGISFKARRSIKKLCDFKSFTSTLNAIYHSILMKKKGVSFLPFTAEPQPPHLIRKAGISIPGPRMKQHLWDQQSSISMLKKLKTENFRVDIVIPVYNALGQTRRCINSVLAKTRIPYRLILVNDASTEEGMSDYLQGLEEFDQIIVINNNENLGFVKSANVGMKLAQSDVILLNNDTEVPSMWDIKLLHAVYQQDSIVTATPFSNAAGAFSVPRIGVNGPLPQHLDLEAVSKLVGRIGTSLNKRIPTGNGFCMYIKQKAFQEVGYFDEQHFGKGYGEENDFCMRLSKKGFSHVLVSNAYVYHEGSVSFGSEKQQLIKQHRAVLNRLHPTYTEEVGRFTSDPDLANLRRKFQQCLEDEVAVELANRRNILIVLHEGGGGVPQTNMDLVRQIQHIYNIYLLTSDTEYLRLSVVDDDEKYVIEEFRIPVEWSARLFESADFEVLYLDILLSYQIDLVHIRHFFKHTFDVANLCKLLKIPYFISHHDYYLLSPSINLLDEQEQYAEGKMPFPWFVPSPMLDDLPQTEAFLHQWKDNSEGVLRDAVVNITTCQRSKKIIESEFEQVALNQFRVIEHGRDFQNEDPPTRFDTQSQKLRFLAIGNISPHKGSRLIRQLQIHYEDKIEMHIAGSVKDMDLNGIIYHGRYKREELGKLIRNIKPDIGLLLSIWPETYSHVLTEYWEHHIPTIGINLGAVGERIDRHGGGWLINASNAFGELQELIDRIIGDRAEIYQKRQEIQKIEFRSTLEMAVDYVNLYNQTLYGKTSEPVGVFIPGFNGSTYIRILLPLMRQNATIHHLNNLDQASLKSYLEKYSIRKVIIQRNGIDEQSLLVLKQLHDLYVVMDLDDDLLNIDKSHPEYAYYASQKQLILDVMFRANQIQVSTPALQEDLENEGYPVRLVSHKLDPVLWFSPLSSYKARRDRSRIVIGYFGTGSHVQDLEMIKPAFLNARLILKDQFGIELSLEVIGVTSEEENWFQVIDVPREKKVYPRFVRFLRNRACMWDIGIAPLIDTAFNRRKSRIKIDEFLAMDLPVICSDVGPYASVFEGEKVFKVNNDIQNWSEEMIKLSRSIVQSAQKDIITV